MKRRLFIGILLMLLSLVSLSTVTLKAADPTGSSFNFEIETQIGDLASVVTDLGSKNYGDSVTIDAGTYNTDYEFATYIVNGKVEPTMPANHTFIVSSDLEITALYKPSGTVMVAFMDTNQDMLSIQYVTSGGNATPPDISALTKPGLEVAISEWSGSYTGVTEDTVLWVQYTSTISATFTLNVTNGTADKASYNYNEVATVTASGTGNFQHWEKDGIIMSLNPTYSFTVLAPDTMGGSEVSITAVYDDVESSPDPDSLFMSMSMNPALDSPTNVLFVGQFVLPEGNSLVEYGFITSSYGGGITFNTPDVVKIRSNKYFSQTNEFVRSVDFMSMSNNIRAYMITTDGTTETITYSDMKVFGDLIISEYIEGSSSNKAIEIYNGVGYDINLAVYSITTYANGATDESGTTYDLDLTGTIAAGDVYVVANASADAAILAESDITSSITYFNGNDAVTLKKSGIVVDIIGEVGVDPGTGWDVGGVTNATAEHTLVRKASVISRTSTFNPDQWEVYDQDTFDYIGSHTVTPIVPTSITITGDASVMSGLTIDLDVTYDPTTSTEDVLWFSSNEAVATVDEFGVVTGVSAGTVTISAYSYVDHNVMDTHSVEVTVPVTYSVTYEENSGSVVADETGITANTAATEPADPTRTDYVFDGWYTDDGTFANLFDFGTLINSDYTLYAKWLDEFTVTFDAQNLDPLSTVQVGDGRTITALDPEPTKTDFVFDGWYTSTDSGTTLDTLWDFDNDTVTGDFTLYAKWVASGSVTYSTDLFISEYIEGSSSNKAIEIYNNTGSSVDLSIYTIRVYSNGSTSPTSISLTGTLSHGDTYVVANTSANAAIKALADLLSGSLSHNGDDAIALAKEGTNIDVFGQIGFDPGSSWSENGVSTVNTTLVRKSSITDGDTIGSDVFDPSAEWTPYPSDTTEYLGSHSIVPE